MMSQDNGTFTQEHYLTGDANMTYHSNFSQFPQKNNRSDISTSIVHIDQCFNIELYYNVVIC